MRSRTAINMLTRTLLVLCWLPTLMNFGNKQYGDTHTECQYGSGETAGRREGGAQSRGKLPTARLDCGEPREAAARRLGIVKGGTAMPRVRDS